MRQTRTRFSTELAWLIAAALLVVLGTQTPVASHLSPKGGIGYALGIIGGLLLLTPALCAFRTRMLSSRGLLLAGTLAPVLILIHCGCSLGATNSNIALTAMLLVACSSLVGRRLQATRTVAGYQVYERLFAAWRVLHVLLFLVLIAAVIVHIITVHVY